MHKPDLTDTIAAIATSCGESGIGIVRLSGKEALKIADRIFVSKDKKKPSEFKTYTLHYGWITAKEIIDEVLLTVMRAPKSYTREDVVEINCHGGLSSLRRAMDLVLENGCRLAEPGEFTRRAFLNGRIDLAQAEAVLDIIRAKTDTALKIGVEQLKGALSAEINKIRQILLGALSRIEAEIDFPEEETGRPQAGVILGELALAAGRLQEILAASKRARIFREGIQVVICGRPNTGKSSLLNALLKRERSIVTPIAGTTRDTIEEELDIKGIPARIIDTAGILKPRGLIEKKALSRSKSFIETADLIILLFDGSRKLSSQDRLLISRLKARPVIAAINKIDLEQKIKRDEITAKFTRTLEISAKKARNMHLLEEAIADFVYNGRVIPAETVMVGNLRHCLAIKEAAGFIARAQGSLRNKLSAEFVCEDLKKAISQLDNILGRHFLEELLDKIFSDFCIGK